MGFSTESFDNYMQIPYQEIKFSSKTKNRKSQSTKSVDFQPIHETKYYESTSLSSQEIQSRWYSNEELEAIRMDAINIVASIEASKRSSDRESLRGLESLTVAGKNRSHAQTSIQAVLKEQARLQENGVNDSKRLQQVYHQRSAYRQRIAHLTALDDAAAAAQHDEGGNDCDYSFSDDDDTMKTYDDDRSVSNSSSSSRRRLNLMDTFRLKGLKSPLSKRSRNTLKRFLLMV